MTVASRNISPNPELASLRHALIDNGYTAVPVEGKSPHGTKRWQKLKPDHRQVDGLIRHAPQATNTGILAGAVVAIDVDVPDVDTAARLGAMVRELPGGNHALCRIGKAPKALYLFRADAPREKISTAKYRIGGHVCQVEVLGAGQQFVAFGIHPDTGKPYEWEAASPLEVALDDLPMIDGATVDGFLAEAEAVLAAVGEPVKKAKLKAEPLNVGRTFWQQVNTAALGNLEAWVPTLFPSARRESGTGAWRVTSKDLGRAFEEDVSIHPDGIQDFGTETSATATQLVIEYGGAPTPRDAAFWLCDRMGIDPAALGWQHRPAAAVHFGTAPPPPSADNDDDEDAALPIPTASTSGLPLELCYPPGAVGEFARWVASCARFPSPHLSLASALALTAGLIGRRYRGPTGLRSNLYLIALAESGFGKDITIRAAEALADSTPDGTRVSEHIFADKLRSLPGLAGRLRKSPSCIAVIDEFGKFLALHTGKNVAPHREEIATALMELTGAPSGSWGGAEKASGNIKRIIQPCLTIHGVSTPSTFWAALSSGNISEGLLGRLVLIDAGDGEPVKVRRPAGSLDNVPSELSAKVSALLGGSAGHLGAGPWHALSANPEAKPWPTITVEFAPGVEDLFEAFDDRMRAMRTTLDPQYRPILNRVGENAARLALIVAVGCDTKKPVITAEIQDWANAVAHRRHAHQDHVGAD
ncbi:bifunctional DNA primase/polymerase [Ancylobacter sp. Lp-2]|uniref:bifunctional DNA primase/polymerase n=1 Tax=Ancylobacter sp. Lp-2 TaxID=2881339 RepID=UPI001E494E67|nr:bifunctional DNA primase/polymerase [Ancylobacter sp. Lp-2]MCB4767842.1 bifunctional DNA primase/polymerase [Ancylobacter sp. Lp-2]